MPLTPGVEATGALLGNGAAIGADVFFAFFFGPFWNSVSSTGRTPLTPGAIATGALLGNGAAIGADVFFAFFFGPFWNSVSSTGRMPLTPGAIATGVLLGNGAATGAGATTFCGEASKAGLDGATGGRGDFVFGAALLEGTRLEGGPGSLGGKAFWIKMGDNVGGTTG
jgi:hypothetical protein